MFLCFGYSLFLLVVGIWGIMKVSFVLTKLLYFDTKISSKTVLS